MNYIFISPNYPAGHRRYVGGLRESGHNIFGVGDAGYESFTPDLRGNLTEYYRVGDLHDYDAVYRACAHFVARYGRIDRIESLNPYWSDLVAALSAEFCRAPRSPEPEYTLLRRKYAALPGLVPHIISSSPKKVCAFAADYGYPLRACPVGNKRLGSRILVSDAGVRTLLRGGTKDEYVFSVLPEGEKLSVDGLMLGGRLVACAAHTLCDDVVSVCFSAADKKLSERCEETALAAGCKDGFFHIDAVRLSAASAEIGKKGAVAFISFENTPPHEYIIDCMNIEFGCDLRRTWAKGELVFIEEEPFACLAPAVPQTDSDAQTESAAEQPTAIECDNDDAQPTDCADMQEEKSDDMPMTVQTGTELPLEPVCCAAVACRSFERSYKNRHERILRKLNIKLAAHEKTSESDRWSWMDYVYVFKGANAAELRRGIKFITEDY